MPGRQDRSSYLPLPLQGQCTYEKEDVRVLPVTMPMGADGKILIRPQISYGGHRGASYNRMSKQKIAKLSPSHA